VRSSFPKSRTDKLINSFYCVLLVCLGIDKISKLNSMIIPKNFGNCSKFDMVQIALNLLSQIRDRVQYLRVEFSQNSFVHTVNQMSRLS